MPSFCQKSNSRMLSLLISCSFAVGACTNHSQQRPVGSKINPELFGSWSNDYGCKLSLAPESDTIRLQSFSDTQGHSLQQLTLAVTKQSIFTRLSPRDKRVKFSASFSEGLITVDDYCHQALHKVTD